MRLKTLIDKDDSPYHMKKHNRDLIDQVHSYCVNEVECRRRLVLQYFDEDFPRSECNKTCDNCHQDKSAGYVTKDVTMHVRNLVEMVQEAMSRNGDTSITARELEMAYRGSQSANVSQPDLCCTLLR